MPCLPDFLAEDFCQCSADFVTHLPPSFILFKDKLPPTLTAHSKGRPWRSWEHKLPGQKGSVILYRVFTSPAECTLLCLLVAWREWRLTRLVAVVELFTRLVAVVELFTPPCSRRSPYDPSEALFQQGRFQRPAEASPPEVKAFSIHIGSHLPIPVSKGSPGKGDSKVGSAALYKAW